MPVLTCRPHEGLRFLKVGTLLASATVLACAASNSAAAQPVAPPAASPPAATPIPPGQSTSAVINLVRLLVQQGVLTQETAEQLIRQAQDEAAATARTQQAAVPATAAEAAQAFGTSVRVPYVPQIVKKQITEEVKQEVMQQARDENWAAPNAVPEWTKRFHLNGDFRLRYEWDNFDSRNSNAFPNFAMLDSGSPFDLNNSAGTPPPILDTTKDRQRLRIRARLGVNVDVSDDLLVGMRLATGNTTNPVTTNQTLGTTLNKDSFTLDRAFLQYEPADWAKFWVGRFANPWLYTELVWDDDINFDGVAAQFSGQLLGSLSGFTTLGVFPIENTAFNFPDNTVLKQGSRDKWLYAAQAGIDWQPRRSFDFKLGAAYYYFSNLEGKLSAPCVANTATDPCSTDDSRPGFLQQGNTLFAIRDLVSNSTTPPLFQYYGLASPFHDLDVTTRFDVTLSGSTHIVLDGDVVKNLAYSKRNIAAKNPVNNIGPDTVNGTVTTPGTFDGGDLGYLARLTIGTPEIHERWEWNLNAAYRYLGSDATPDAFADSDFHLGGTNAKGYIVGGALGLAHNVDLTARWLSASEVTSLPYTVDVVQVDLNARF